MMINRRHTKEREEDSCSQTLRLRKSMLSFVCLVAILASSVTNGVLAQQYGTRGNAAESTDEDLQVIFTEPIENLVTYPSWSRTVTPSISLYEQELARCKLSQSKLLLSFVMSAENWQDVEEKQVARALHRLSKFFAIPKDYFKLDDISRTDIYEMLRNSPRRGPNHLASITSRKLGRLSFVVGCNNVMFPTGKLIASQIGEQMSEGLIADITDLNLDWWSLWTQRPNNRMNRTKRQAMEGSGEADGELYDEDYEEEDDVDPEGGVTEVPVQTPRHRHHHGDNGKPTGEPIETVQQQQTRGQVIDTDKDSAKGRQHVQIDLSSLSTAGSTAASTEGMPKKTTTTTSFWATTPATIPSTTAKPTATATTEQNIVATNTVTSFAPTQDTPAPTLDPDMRESVSILESDINKTIENNDKKLKEEQMRLERILQQQQRVQGSTTGLSAMVTSSERSSYDLAVDFVTPIIETIPEDERIEVIQTIDPEFNFEESLAKTNTDRTPTPALIEERTTKMDVVKAEGEDVEKKTVIETQTGEESVIEDFGGLETLTTGSNFAPTTTEIATTETSTTVTTMATTTATSGQVTTTVVPAAVDNAAVDATTTDKDIPEETGDYYEYFDPEAEDKETKPSSTPAAAPTFSSTSGLNIFRTDAAVPTTTEYVEPEVINTPPVIKSRLPKQPLTAGKPFGFAIPMETFFDAEDGTNLKLTLLDKNDQPLKSNSWIQFDENKREVYGLPLEEVVSRWQYKLHATDKAGESVIETLDLSVQQHKSYRSVNHEISIALRLAGEFKNAVDWQLQLIRGIVELAGDSDMSSILVREIRSSGSGTELNPWTFVFTNDSLPKDKCPEEELTELLKRFETTQLNQLLAPEIVISSIAGQQIGNCLKTNVVKAKPTPSIAKNYPPLTRNQVDRVNAIVGNLLVFQVPLDTFYDPEDKTDLKLSLLTSERKELPAHHWLQFDSKNREFYGIPLPMDFGQKEYLLVAEDSEGLTATDALVVTVNNPKPRDYNAIIQLHMNRTVDMVNSPLIQRRFVERLAQVFGDADTSNIKVRALPQQYNRGLQSTFSYQNTSIYRMHNQQCPDDEVEKLRAVLLERDGTLRDSVKITFGSEFKVFRAQFVAAGSCQAADTSMYDPIKPIRPSDKQVPTSSGDDYMLTFIIPAAIILTMLLLGAIIACVLHRRRMTGKMELGDEEERRSFRSKGIPVIFHDELEEKPEIVTKSPIILKDEKPPLLPPSYNSTAIDGDSEDVDEYVPPPAVMMGNRESRGKSPVTPSYRKPPPYVSP